MNSRDIFIVTSVAASFVAGSGLGYFLAKKKLGAEFDQMLTDEIAQTKAFYERVNKVGDFATPEAAAETLVGEAATALVNYGARSVPGGRVITDVNVHEMSLNKEPNPFAEAAGVESIAVAPPEEEDEHHNVWDEPAEAYPITAEDFLVNDTAYDQVSVTYYEGDSVVAEHDKPLADVDRCVGIGNLATYGDEDIIYVRNDRLKTDYEIAKSTGTFAFEVLGLGDDGLQHSDEPFPRKRRLRDD